jgi:hypothetical protein
MRPHRRLAWVGLLIAAGLAGCADDVPSPTVPPLAVVSGTAMPPDAEAALKMCFVPWGQIAGIGLVPHARDAWWYVPLSGREPEIQTDAPAWLIQVRGPLQAPLDPEIAVDPTCVVIAGQYTLFGTGGSIDQNGVVHSPRTVVHPPGSLPPLGP